MEPFNNLLERFKSPIVGSFILTWLTFNWRIPYITFFLDQNHSGFTNKLVAVENVIKNTSCLELLILPLFFSIVLVLGIPGLNHITNLFPTYLKYVRLKDEIDKEQELNGIKQKNNIINGELTKLRALVKNELIKRILGEKLDVNDIFLGQWRIFRQTQNATFEYNNCYFKENDFIDDSKKTIILTIYKIGRGTSHDTNKELIAVCRLEEEDTEGKLFNVTIEERHKIILRDKTDSLHTIELQWTHMQNVNI